VANEPKNIMEELCNVMDTVSDPVLQMSDTEILAEAVQSGEDPEETAAQMKALLLSAVKNYRQRRLGAAQEQYEREAHTSRQQKSNLPSSAEERRMLLSLVCRQTPEIGAALLTLQHRDLGELTDADVESSLEELQELGALDDLHESEDL
jgi:hypothetical protein